MQNLTHWKQLMNPAYIGAYSLQPGEERQVEIISVGKQEVVGPDGKKDMCTVATLKNEKPFILNSTNCKTLSKIYETPYIENWKGRRVIIYAEKIKAFGELVEALRIRPVKPMLPGLTPQSAKWSGAVEAIKNGTTLEAIEKRYSLTEENKSLLLNQSNIPA